jgi:AraC-like DNA-binding protein
MFDHLRLWVTDRLKWHGFEVGTAEPGLLPMARNDITPQAACAQVGHKSPSQLNRGFKRFFGRKPNQEANVLRRQ